MTLTHSAFFVSALWISLWPAVGQPLASGPRAAGLADAATSLPVDRFALGNPASPAASQGVGLAVSASRSFGMSELDHASCALALGTRIGAIAAAIESFGFDEFRRHTIHLVLTPTKLFDPFSFGARISYSRMMIRDFGSRGYARAAVGMLVNVVPGVAVGAMVHNLIRGRDTEMDSIRRIDLGTRVALSDRLILYVDIHKDSGFEPSAHAGLEFFALGPVVLRGAFSTTPSSLSFGIGARRGIVEAGTASRRHQTLGWSRSAGFAIGH